MATAETITILRPLHLRIGLEDYAGPDQPTNVELVERAVALAAAVGRRVATPAETAAALRGDPGIS